MMIDICCDSYWRLVLHTSTFRIVLHERILASKILNRLSNNQIIENRVYTLECHFVVTLYGLRAACVCTEI